MKTDISSHPINISSKNPSSLLFYSGAPVFVPYNALGNSECLYTKHLLFLIKTSSNLRIFKIIHMICFELIHAAGVRYCTCRGNIQHILLERVHFFPHKLQWDMAVKHGRFQYLKNYSSLLFMSNNFL